MKAAETRSSKSAANSNKPFFSKNGDGSFFGSGDKGFFQSSGNNPGSVQAKLKVGNKNDAYEKEADSVADRVVKQISHSNAKEANPSVPVGQSNTTSVSKVADTDEKMMKKEKEKEQVQKREIQRKPIFESNAEPDDDPTVQRKCEACDEKEMINKKGETETDADNSDGLESRLNSNKGSGSPLSPALNDSMSQAMGADFSNVRIHDNSEAEQMSNDLDAQAFTHGNDIYFNSGKYDTKSKEGKHLLAHELTHTVQQGGAAVQTKSSDMIQRAPAKPPVQTVSSGVVNIASGEFKPSDAIREEIATAGDKGLDVRVIVPGISEEGRIKMKMDRKGNFVAWNHMVGYMAVTNPWAKQLGGLYLRFTVKDNAITGGFVSPSTKGGNPADWIKKIKENASLLGGVGLKVGKIPTPINEFSGNTFKLGFSDLDVEVGGFIKAKFSLALENGAKPKIDAMAEVNVKGVVKGQLLMNNTKDKLTGEVSLGIDYKDFSGSVLIKYLEDGSIDIKGKGAYNANKLSGEVEFVSTDLESANNFAKEAIKAAGGKENVQNAVPPEAAPAPNEGKKERALAAVGKLQFNLTKWFAGTVNVIVDGKGAVTVIGKIAPPAEIQLFDQKNFEKEIISLQVEAGYGIPVIGTVGLFAGIGLWAVAYIGPAKLYNIEVTGTYSTDPEVQKNIEIAASINISAYAGLRLRAEGGLKLTIVSHDLKLGVGVNADVGIKAYADARPKIGYRDPGEFFISGTADLVAQPMLGLSGDFFIQVDAPWWSPIDDDIWKWPIGSKEWPMGDPIGLSATMKDYVLGSGVAPEIDINKKPQFDPNKFMTKMVDKQLPEKSGAGKEAQGTFKDDGTVPAHEVPDPKAQPPKDGALKGQEPPPLKEGAKKPPPDPAAQKEAAKLFQDGAKKLEAIKGPVTKADLRKELDSIEKAVSGIHYVVKLEGDQWSVTGSAKGIDNPKPYKVTAIVTDADKKPEGKEDNINTALTEIDSEGKKETDEGGVTEKEAQSIKDKVNADHPSVIQISSVIDGGETWDFEYIQKTKKSISKGSRPIKTKKTEVKQNSKSAKAFPLTADKGGSVSTVDIEGWDHARKLNMAKSPDTQGRGGDWVKGHKISYRLGGEGNDTANLFIIDRSANGKMAGTEIAAQQELNRLIALKDAEDPEYNKVMYYEIKFDLHGSSLPLKAFGDSIAIKYGTANADGGNKAEKGSLELTSEKPPENADVVNFNINNTGWQTFYEVTKNKNIKLRFATNLMSVRNEKGKFKNFGDLERKMIANHDSNISEESVKEQLSILSGLVDESLNVTVK